MGSLLEEMHKMRLKEKIDELESMGGNPHVADHGLGGVDIFSMKIKKGDHLQHCPIAQSVM